MTHRLPLFLNPDLYMAVIDTQHELRLGKVYAGFVLLVEGAYKRGHLDDQQYKDLMERYTVPFKEGMKQKQAERTNLNKVYQDINAQWHTLTKTRKQGWIEKAQQHPELPQAKLLLELAQK